jgi:hypothetical protein
MRRLSHASSTNPVKVSLPVDGEVTLTVIGEEHLAPVELTGKLAVLVSLGSDLRDRGGVLPGEEAQPFATIDTPAGLRVFVGGRRVSTNEALELVALALGDALGQLVANPLE